MQSRPYLHYAHRTKLRPFFSFLIIITLMAGAYYFGLNSVHPINVIEQKSTNNDVVANTDNVSGVVVAENPVEEEKLEPVEASVKRELGKFHDELFYLEWKELRDPSDISIKSVTPAILKKINAQAKMVTVAENIVAGENKSIDGLSNLTSDNKSILLKLNCLNGEKASDCTVEKTFLALDLESGRAMNITSILSSVQQRSKLPVCKYIPTDNFVQNNLLFVCEDAESDQSVYKYNLSTLAVGEVEKLKPAESLLCKDPKSQEAVANYESLYKDQSLEIKVCSKEDQTKNIRTITVKDI